MICDFKVFFFMDVIEFYLRFFCFVVYYVGFVGWKKMIGDDVGEFYYKYYLVQEVLVEVEMGEV